MRKSNETAAFGYSLAGSVLAVDTVGGQLQFSRK